MSAETFEAPTDDEAHAFATELANQGQWLDHEVWNEDRLLDRPAKSR
ncbi:MAG TPA: hypothetical protein VHU87_07730 [Rhizomicrobium sp.]|nr:hypothetical protein [Rhizomicrobium sp.]